MKDLSIEDLRDQARILGMQASEVSDGLMRRSLSNMMMGVDLASSLKDAFSVMMWCTGTGKSVMVGCTMVNANGDVYVDGVKK